MTQTSLLEGTPYHIDAVNVRNGIVECLKELSDGVQLLRSTGKLNPDTLRAYFGQTRFEQIAESAAIEGSTLDAGETELAVMKGVTVSGHEPRFSRDAVGLAGALDTLVEIARTPAPTELTTASRIHSCILQGDPGAGTFRSTPVYIRGATHVPPGSWNKIIEAMEAWESWSVANRSAHPVIRATVLHAWLVHIHPYTDGNGRTARAILNLELVAAGYPSIIIRRTEKQQYFECLACADAGDISPFLEIVIGKVEQALSALAQIARAKQGYDKEVSRLQKTQRRRHEVWSAAIGLLQRFVESELRPTVEQLGGTLTWHAYSAVPFEPYLDMCSGRSARLTSVFRFEIALPALPKLRRLLWVGCRSSTVESATRSASAHPSLFWSVPSGGFPAWRPASPDESLAFREATLDGDVWRCARQDGSTPKFGPLEVGTQIVKSALSAIEG